MTEDNPHSQRWMQCIGLHLEPTML